MSESDHAGVESLWVGTTRRTDYPQLDRALEVDTAIVGGGITGLTAAIRLTEAGQTVAVIESDRIVEGTTGYTTAKLTSQHGLVYDHLLTKFGLDKARQYASAQEAAIDEVETRVTEAPSDCGFERRPAYTYAVSSDDRTRVRRECEAARELGLPATFTDSTDLPYDVRGAIRFDDQAQFHPRKYLLSVAESVDDAGSHVFERTRATDIDAGSPCEVETTHGSVVAEDVIVASHFPFYDHAGYFARMHPKQAYLLAVEIEGSPPTGMYYGLADPPVTLRSYEDLLIVGGQRHDTGDTDPPTSERYRRCEEFARANFDVRSVPYRWSTHDYYSVDRVPFIGRLGPGTEHVYVGTGYGGWGMTGGTVAGILLSDLILTGSNPWAEVFDPMRITPRASTRAFVEENVRVAGRFVADRTAALVSKDAMPAAGEATVVHEHGDHYGVYRDEDHTIHAVSAVCPHMKCLVRWNDAERTWDCPCHGSRFTYDGEVLSGPALEDLPKR